MKSSDYSLETPALFLLSDGAEKHVIIRNYRKTDAGKILFPINSHRMVAIGRDLWSLLESCTIQRIHTESVASSMGLKFAAGYNRLSGLALSDTVLYFSMSHKVVT